MSFVAIQDFCQTGSGGTPSRAKADRYYGGTIPWVRSGELREGVITETGETITQEAIEESSAKLVPSGALLVAMYGATIGRVAELGVDAATNQAVCHILPKEGTADRRYMFHALCSKATEWVGKGAGGAQPNISQGIIKETKIFLPPLPEQKRIAAILDKADEIRRKRAEAIKLTEELLRSAFLEMFGDPVTNPKGWDVLTLERLAPEKGMIVDGPFGSSLKPESYVSSGVPVVRNVNIKPGRFDAGKFKFVTQEKFDELRRSEVAEGDVLISTKGTVGNVCRMPHLSGPAVLSASGTVRLRMAPNSSLVEQFLVSQMTMPNYREYIQRRTAGSIQKYLNLSDIRKFEVVAPPRELQEKFETARRGLEAQQACLATSAARLEALGRSLTQRAFRGEL